jgi:hypothetical protein
MNDKEIDAQIKALLEITDNNVAEAIYLVCLDISMKESSKDSISLDNYCG